MKSRVPYPASEKREKEEKMKMKRNLKNWVAGALMLSCMSSEALCAEEKKEVSEKDLMAYLGPVVASAYPHFTDEERKAFSNLLSKAHQRRYQLETEKEEKRS